MKSHIIMYGIVAMAGLGTEVAGMLMTMGAGHLIFVLGLLVFAWFTRSPELAKLANFLCLPGCVWMLGWYADRPQENAAYADSDLWWQVLSVLWVIITIAGFLCLSTLLRQRGQRRQA